MISPTLLGIVPVFATVEAWRVGAQGQAPRRPSADELSVRPTGKTAGEFLTGLDLKALAAGIRVGGRPIAIFVKYYEELDYDGINYQVAEVEVALSDGVLIAVQDHSIRLKVLKQFVSSEYLR